MAVYECILRLDSNRKMWWDVLSKTKDLAVVSDNTFWPDLVSSVQMAGAVDFLMAHKEPFVRTYYNFAENRDDPGKKEYVEKIE